MEVSSGMRVMQTFRKLPTMIPRRKKKAMSTVWSTVSRSQSRPTVFQSLSTNVPHSSHSLNKRRRLPCPIPNSFLCYLCLRESP
jgi:hypothetical protein